VLPALGAMLGLMLGLVFGACSRKVAPRLKVAVTLFPIYDLARTVAGVDADVVLLVPPEPAPHDLHPPDPPPGAVDQVSGAKLGIMVGLGFDEWMKALLEQAAPSAHRLVAGDRVPTLPLRSRDPHADEKPDPYVWLDPARAILISNAMAEEMARVDSAHAAGYRSRSFALQQRLDALDRDVEARIATWPSRSFASFPLDFAYYADRYRLAPSANVDPSQRTGVANRALDPIGGQPQTDSYEKLIRFDTDTLERIVKSPLPPVEDGSVSPPPAPGADGSQAH